MENFTLSQIMASGLHTASSVLIGFHVCCDYKIFGIEFKPFHALIYFSSEGVFVED